MTQLSFDNIFSAITDEKQESADLKFRADLMLVMRDIFEFKGWKQSDVVSFLDIPQSRASELMRGKVDKFSSDKLIGFLAKLGFQFRPKFFASDFLDEQIKCSVDCI